MWHQTGISLKLRFSSYPKHSLNQKPKAENFCLLTYSMTPSSVRSGLSLSFLAMWVESDLNIACPFWARNLRENALWGCITMIKFFLKLFILIKNILPHLGREGGIRRGTVTGYVRCTLQWKQLFCTLREREPLSLQKARPSQGTHVANHSQVTVKEQHSERGEKLFARCEVAEKACKAQALPSSKSRLNDVFVPHRGGQDYVCSSS